jgi:hypothetical protein
VRKAEQQEQQLRETKGGERDDKTCSRMLKESEENEMMKQAIDKRSPVSEGKRRSEGSESRQGKHRISTESPFRTGEA